MSGGVGSVFCSRKKVEIRWEWTPQKSEAQRQNGCATPRDLWIAIDPRLKGWIGLLRRHDLDLRGGLIRVWSRAGSALGRYKGLADCGGVESEAQARLRGIFTCWPLDADWIPLMEFGRVLQNLCISIDCCDENILHYCAK